MPGGRPRTGRTARYCGGTRWPVLCTILSRINLGLALAGRGQLDEAIAEYRAALQISPNYAEAENSLGAAPADCRQFDEAISHYRKALEINPQFVEAHFNLGALLASHGLRDEAMAHFQKALGLASARNDHALAGAIRAQLGLYQSLAPARNAL